MSKGNILLSSARSGTNYLLTAYSKCFPRNFVAKEIFRPTGDSFPLIEELTGLNKDEVLALVATEPVELWQKIVSAAEAEEREALAKIFYYHVDKADPLWSHFRDNDKVIHLIRRNAFDVFLSHKVANQTGKWQEFGKNKAPTEVEPLVLNRAEVVAFMDKQRDHVDHARTFFAKADYAELFYEDIADSVDTCVKSICTVFERPLPSHPISIGLRKQKDKSNQELVANYDDVAEFDRFLF